MGKVCRMSLEWKNTYILLEGKSEGTRADNIKLDPGG
jgi:hypothetical protein